MIRVLFAGGHSAEVRVTLYQASGDRARLLDAYVTTECEGAVTRSARRAAEAVLNWLPEETRPREPLVAGFDLSGLSADQTLAGESAGLAFAIALAAELTGREPGPLAATGILAESSGRSPILQVNGIPAKLQSALRSLPPRSRIFLPDANSATIGPELHTETQLREIDLVKVRSLDHALEAVFNIGNVPSEEKKDRTFRPELLATFIVLFAVPVAFFTFTGLDAMNPEAPVAISAPAPSEARPHPVPEPRVEERIGPETEFRESPSGLEEDVAKKETGPPEPLKVESGQGFD